MCRTESYPWGMAAMNSWQLARRAASSTSRSDGASSNGTPVQPPGFGVSGAQASGQ